MILFAVIVLLVFGPAILFAGNPHGPDFPPPPPGELVKQYATMGPGVVGEIARDRVLRDEAMEAMVVGSYRADLAHNKEKIDTNPGPK